MRKSLAYAAVLSIVIAILYVLGIQEGYFWSVWWWDIVLHFLGGIWVAVFAFAVLPYIGVRPGVLAVALAVVAASVGWEVLEYVGNFPHSPFMSYSADTAKDLFVDVLGGIVGFVWMRYVRA